MTPKLSNSEQIWLSSFLANVLDKSGKEILVNVLDSIEAEPGSVIAKDRMDPRPPVE